MKGFESNLQNCTKLILNSITANFFNIVTALSNPKASREMEYDDLLKLLENHLAPKMKFLSKYQSEGLTIAEFVAILRTDISYCEFVSSCACKSSIADVFVRTQFIRAISDNNIREKLLESRTCKFDKIVAKALELEAAKVATMNTFFN